MTGEPDPSARQSPNLFGYEGAIVEQYPMIRAGVVHAAGVTNPPSSTALLAEYRAEQASVVERLGDKPLSDLGSIRAWRRAFARFGVKPTQYRSATEALLRRLTKHGDIPSINTLADIGNLISIRYALPVAVFDREGIAGATTVRLATGDEAFTDLGSSEIVHPEPSEVIFVDEENVVSARRWCWRQSRQSATGPTTTDALIVIEGLHDDASVDVDAAIVDLVELLGLYQPESRVETYSLSASTPRR